MYIYYLLTGSYKKKIGYYQPLKQVSTLLLGLSNSTDHPTATGVIGWTFFLCLQSMPSAIPRLCAVYQTLFVLLGP